MPQYKQQKFARLFVLSIVLLGILSLLIVPSKTHALTLTQQGQKVITAVVEGPPPSTPPTIESPSTGLNFDNKNIAVSGSCISSLIVKIFSNNVFVGSAICQSGTYTMQIDLFVDRNDLVARQYDALNQPSPDSDTVTVYYIPPATQPALPSSSSIPSTPANLQSNFSLFINYDYTILGIFPNEVYNLPITFGGGTPPYAVSIDWGDGTSSLYSRDSSAKFNAEHIYKTPGQYTVKIRVTDRFGELAYLQYVVVVNGPTKPFINQIFGDGYPLSWWPLLAISLLATLSFLGGVYYQKNRHKKHR